MGQESVDTLRIFEELSPTLGEEAARKLASLLGSMYVELRDVVRREDFTDLHHLVGDLADTQRGTEASVTQLAEAQSRTAAAVFHNSTRIDLMNKQYGGLSASLGYTLENEAYHFLPTLLKDDFDLAVEGTLCRDYLSDVNGNDMEINILGDGTRKGENLLIIGECKSQLSKNNVDSFLKRRLRKLDTGARKVFPIMVTHMVSQKDVVDYARGKGVAVYLSYQFPPSN